MSPLALSGPSGANAMMASNRNYDYNPMNESSMDLAAVESKKSSLSESKRIAI